MEIFKKIKKSFLGSIFCFIFCCLFFTDLTQAASLFFSPESGTQNLGNNFSVSVCVSSSDQSINGVSGSISFPADKLEVVSVSKSNSIVNFWAQEPSYSNGLGSVNFEGIVLNPGYQGKKGNLLNIVFKAKAAGNIYLDFINGSVLANDGLGTDILSDLGRAAFLLGGQSVGQSSGASSGIISGIPEAPIVISSTHPDSNKWYKSNSVKFNWEIPKGVTAVRILYDKYPYSLPAVVYSPAINQKQISGLKDGIWYFHAQFKNEKGWGIVSHFRLKIDSQSPSVPKINFIDGKESYKIQPQVKLEAQDDLSGMAYYRIKIGDESFIEYPAEKIINNTLSLASQVPGKRQFLVQAFDNAGNSATAMDEFEIKALNYPEIIEYSRILSSGERLKIMGKTYPEAKIDFWIQKENCSPEESFTRAGADGTFIFYYPETLKDGDYKFWMQTTSKEGYKSLVSASLDFSVQPPSFIRIGKIALNYLTVIIPLVILIAFLIFLIAFIFHKFFAFRKKLRKEIREAEYVAREESEFLRKEISAQIFILEEAKKKRRLTEEEEKIMQLIKKGADELEKINKRELKEIRDVEKEIK